MFVYEFYRIINFFWYGIQCSSFVLFSFPLYDIIVIVFVQRNCPSLLILSPLFREDLLSLSLSYYYHSYLERIPFSLIVITLIQRVTPLCLIPSLLSPLFREDLFSPFYLTIITLLQKGFLSITGNIRYYEEYTQLIMIYIIKMIT